MADSPSGPTWDTREIAKNGLGGPVRVHGPIPVQRTFGASIYEADNVAEIEVSGRDQRGERADFVPAAPDFRRNEAPTDQTRRSG